MSMSDRAKYVTPGSHVDGALQVVGLGPCWKDVTQDLPAEVREPQQKKADWDKPLKDRGQGSVTQSQRVHQLIAEWSL